MPSIGVTGPRRAGRGPRTSQPGRAATDDLLDIVDPESDKRLGRKALRDELITLDMAGHETTANATRWAWLLLAQHPPIAERLYPPAYVQLILATLVRGFRFELAPGKRVRPRDLASR